MELGNYIMGVAINSQFGIDNERLFSLLDYPKMVKERTYSFNQLIQERIIEGDQVEGLVIGQIGKGTLIFSFEVFCREDLLEKISRGNKVFCFLLDGQKDHFNIKYYVNGILERDNFSDNQYDEIGTPLEIESSGKPVSIILEGLEMILGPNSSISEAEFIHFNLKKSLFNKLFS